MGLLEGQALVEDEVVSVGLYLASWRLTEISDEYWTLLDQACVSLNVLYLAGFFSFLRAKPAGRENERRATYIFYDGIDTCKKDQNMVENVGKGLFNS